MTSSNNFAAPFRSAVIDVKKEDVNTDSTDQDEPVIQINDDINAVI